MSARDVASSLGDSKLAQEYLDKLNETVKISDDEPEADGYNVAPDNENTEIHESGKFNVDEAETDEGISLVITDN